MPRSFLGGVSGLVALIGFAFVVILAAFGYSLSTAFRADDDALSTYAEELILGKGLEESIQRKLADGRGYLLSHDPERREAFDEASADEKRLFAELHRRVKGQDGIRLLGVAEEAAVAHDLALREAMAMQGTREEIAASWQAKVSRLAAQQRTDMDAFINHKRSLYENAKQTAFRVQRRSVFVSASIALLALFVGAAGGINLMRSARNAFRLETKARSAAEKERAFGAALLDQLPIGTVVADASGQIIQVSEWARRMFSGELGAEQLPLAQALRGEVVQQLEVRGPHGRIYSVTGGPIRDRSGKIIAAVCGFVDISERKQSERERELFISVLGHDLRNPLNAISLAADALQRRDDLPAAASKPAARIASSANRMSVLIGELLDFARCQNGVLPIKPERCELKNIAKEIVDEVRLTNPERDIRIGTQGGCDGLFDISRMAQVFQNLIGNAVDHGAPDHPIEVETGCSGSTVWARVKSRGKTIPSEERKRIFEPFRTSGASQGLGLGLYIASAIVQAHGGTIAVESEDGETTFSIELPRRIARFGHDDDRPSA
jgi:signal transduction histidine kinase